MSKQTMNFQDLKVGDEVILYSTLGVPVIEKVSGAYKQYVVVSGFKFNRTSCGRLRGSFYSNTRIEIATPENLKNMQYKIEALRKDRTRTQLIRGIREVDWGQVSLDKLTQVAKLLEKD